MARLSLLTASLCLLPAVLSQSPAITPETSKNATIFQYPGNTWTYQGCYNESTNPNGTDSGLRALVQTDNTGSSSASDDMTVQKCLDFCTSGGFPLAGVEYTRECYCSQTIRADALKDDSRCNLACQGNTSYICGGYRAFNLYKNEKTKKSLSPKGIQETSVGSVLALGIAVGVLLCIT